MNISYGSNYATTYNIKHTFTANSMYYASDPPD